MAVSSQPFAGVGVADAGGEKAGGECKHDKVKHELLLCVAVSGAEQATPAFVAGEVPRNAYDFEAGAWPML